MNLESSALTSQILSECESMGPSIDNPFPTANSGFGNSCDERGTPESDTQINDNTMSSAFDTRTPSPSPSTSNLPMTQITNNGGTIHISYNFHTDHVPRLDKGNSPVIEKVEGTDHAERDPDLTFPLRPTFESSNGEPSSAKSSSKSHVTPENTVARQRDSIPHKKSHQISAISEIEKAEVKQSVDLILLGSISRKDLSHALMNLAQALELINGDEKQCAHVPIQPGTDPSSADPDRACSTGLISPNTVLDRLAKIDPALGEGESVQPPVKSAPISPTNESFQHDCSGLKISAPPACQRTPSSSRDIDADGGNKSGGTSNKTVVLQKNDSSPSLSASTQGERL